MRLSKRPPMYSLPSYSLTGDPVAFPRCGLQYRYTRIGQLPPTHPVQAWFGQFVHGVLEEAYRRYDAAKGEGRDDLPPWSEDRIEEIRDLIKRRLAAQGLFPWDENLERLGNERAETAVNELGPELFPLIHRAEVRLTGARKLPTAKIPAEYRFREADRYEIAGIVDVVTHVQLSDPALQGNRLLEGILRELPQEPPDAFEVIVDYKGMRRPPVEVPSAVSPSFWDIYGWQVQTYAHLRGAHEDSLPVVAGAIIYLNELCPTPGDISSLKKEMREGRTDVVPEPGGEVEKILKGWDGKDEAPELPLGFRLRRALRVVEVTPETVRASLREFDDVVARVETCRGRELVEDRVIPSWEKNPSYEGTCTVCDFRTFCPAYQEEYARKHGERQPRLPGVRKKT
ncbi:MAG: PD-(D/E)XK nuclease family protein [Actinomycetota bacterium]|nr:PD-(D/E)XK nuclease family protein [Actinomycetota bacterium]